MLKKVGVNIRSEQYTVSDELYNAFCQAAGDDFDGEDEESLEAALNAVRTGAPSGTEFLQEPVPEEEDVIEIFVEGNLRISDGIVTLTYTEIEENGMGKLKTVIRYAENEPKTVSMVRFGDVNASFLFEPGKRSKCVYNMPFGAMELTVRTVDVDNRLADDGILVLDYYIEIRGANAEHKCVTISLRF